MASRKLYQALASLISARMSCLERIDQETRLEGWARDHAAALAKLVSEHMPSGAGIDRGTTIDLERSTPEKLVFNTAFHHMDETGYTGWTEHVITVRASLLSGLDLKVYGPNRNDVKDVLFETFEDALHRKVES